MYRVDSCLVSRTDRGCKTEGNGKILCASYVLKRYEQGGARLLERASSHPCRAEGEAQDNQNSADQGRGREDHHGALGFDGRSVRFRWEGDDSRGDGDFERQETRS